jgi:hypothetical protein
MLSAAYDTAVQNLALHASPTLSQQLDGARHRIAAGIIAAAKDGVTDIDDLASEGVRALHVRAEQFGT